MAFFRRAAIQVPDFGTIKSPVPLEHIDVTKRYDIYSFFPGEERLYENMRFVSIKTLDDIRSYTGAFSGLVEIESMDGTRIMLPMHNIHMLCEHGSQPSFKLVRTWGESVNSRVSGMGY
jgi:hypothetical protein